LKPELLAMLACPACETRPPLTLEGDCLICSRCLRAYPIVDGIPQLIVEAALTQDPTAGAQKEPTG
jgi:uncharacterized protein YbaR (Trm112 family)